MRLCTGCLIISYFVNLPNAFITYMLKYEQFPRMEGELLIFIGILPIRAKVCLTPCHHSLQDGDETSAKFS